MEVVEETGDESLVGIVRRQNVIQRVVGPSLREGVELDMQGEAMRWFPMRNSKAIVFHPARYFGQPILAEYDIPTAVAEAKIQIHITQDHRHRRFIERDAIASAGLIVFVLDKGWATQPAFEAVAGPASHPLGGVGPVFIRRRCL